MRFTILAVAVSCACISVEKKSPVVPDPADRITAAGVKAHVAFLADDALDGRGAGYPGEEKAAAYIAEQFRADSLSVSEQTFSFLPRGPEKVGQVLTSRNVIAVLSGGDPSVAGDVIVVGAHHDGQGMAGQADAGRLPAVEAGASADRIWNSADDNASSVAAILEIARAFAGSRPRRTIVFATFGAEEHALNGSAELARSPIPANVRPVAMVNLEKIGRVPDHPLIMAGCSTSPDWRRVLRETNAERGDAVECVLPQLISDTDHYPFAALGIPAVVLGTAHEEDTHRPTDEFSRLDFEALARRARYVARFVENLANRDRVPRFDARTQRGSGMVVVVASAAEREAIGLSKNGALKAGLVLPGLPAAAAGIHEGDFVTAIDKQTFGLEPDDRAIDRALAHKGYVSLSVRRGADAFRLVVQRVPTNRN